MYDALWDKKLEDLPWDTPNSPSFPWDYIYLWGYSTQQIKDKYFSLIPNEEQFNIHIRQDPNYSQRINERINQEVAWRERFENL